MKQPLDYYLSLLRDHDPFTEAQYAVMEARVRREIIARYGSFAIPQRRAAPVEASVSAWRWLLRPAMGVAGVGALIVGAFAASRIARHEGAPADASVPGGLLPITRVISPPLVPGSGSAVSVFTTPEAPAVPRANTSTGGARRAVRQGAPLTPAAGVFTEWGKGVFTDELSKAPLERGVFSG